MPRVDRPELLDLGHGSPADVAANLAEMARINRWLGGVRAITRHLLPRLEHPHPLSPSPTRGGEVYDAAFPSPFTERASGGEAAGDGPVATVADLGTGSADLPVILARWARRRGHRLSVLAVDWAGRNLCAAQTHAAAWPEIRLLRADASRLPLPPQSVDYVISSLFLHHFSPEEAVRMLRSAFACARRGLIMSDVVRGWLPLAAFWLAQPIFARHELTRRDGMLSVRRGYTPAELIALADAAGLPGARVTTHFPFRMTLVVDR